MTLSSSTPRLLRLPALGALLAATLMGAAPAASAAGPGFGFGPLTNAGNWAGYGATGHTFTKITGSWTEAKAVCNADHDLYAPWIGIDGDGTQTVEQTGVQTSCQSGHPVDSAWYEMYPAAPVYYNEPVSTGDKITASVTFNGGNSYTLKISDTTKGWTKSVTKSLSAQNASAEAILEAPGGFPGIPNGVTFTGITVNGKTFSSYHPGKLTSAGFKPGPLNGGTFTVKHT
jgi:Peptidase A4 family